MNTLTSRLSPLAMAQTGLVEAILGAQGRMAPLSETSPTRAVTTELIRQAYAILTHIGTGPDHQDALDRFRADPLATQMSLDIKPTNENQALCFVVLDHLDQIALVIMALRTGEGVLAAAEAMTQGPLGGAAAITPKRSASRVAGGMGMGAAAVGSTDAFAFGDDFRHVTAYLNKESAQSKLAKAMGREDLNPYRIIQFKVPLLPTLHMPDLSALLREQSDARVANTSLFFSSKGSITKSPPDTD